MNTAYLYDRDDKLVVELPNLEFLPDYIVYEDEVYIYEGCHGSYYLKGSSMVIR